jgi:hypothetical protein
MHPARQTLIPYAILLLLAGTLVLPARGLAATTHYRLRLAPPVVARFEPGLTGAWVDELAREIGDERGVLIRPVISTDTAVRLSERRNAMRQQAGLRDSGVDPADPVAELLLWARFAVENGPGDALLAELAVDPRVDRIEEVAVAEICALAPDDPLLRNQLSYLDLVGLPSAWAAADISPLTRIRVAIIDGGTDWQHPDLLDNVGINAAEIDGDGIDQDGNGFIDDLRGWNFANGSPDPAPLPDQFHNGRHGTHVAGTVGAVLGNGIGVAGAGGNPELILVNAAHPSVDNGIAWGYEGILYAITRGADIINCSWRTVQVVSGQIIDAPYSHFEALVLRLARESGALVVAATGNDFSDGLWTTPAGYADAFAVGATERGEAVPWLASNVAPWVDMVAPGQFIISTLPRSTTGSLGPYGLLSGTSMAAALTSGIAALVASQHPEWTPDQLRSRLRWTATSHAELGDLRLARADSAVAAATGPDVALRVLGFVDSGGNGLAEGDETIDIRFSARALFGTRYAVGIEAWTDDPWLVPLIDKIRLTAVPSDSELEVLRGIKFWVHPSAPPGHVARIQMQVTSDGVTGPVESGAILVCPLAATSSNSLLRVSAAANGVLGEAIQVVSELPGQAALSRVGEDFGFLQRAALLIGGRSPDHVSDAMLPRAPDEPYKDFSPAQGGLDLEIAPDGTRTIRLRYSDRSSSNPIGVRVLQTVTLREGAGLDDFVLVEYELTAEDGPHDDLRWGLAMDWSMPAADATSSRGFVAERLVVQSGFRGLRVEAAESGAGLGVAGVRILGDAREIGFRSLAEWRTEDEEGWNVPGDFRSTAPDTVLRDLIAPGIGESLARTGGRVAVISAALGRIERGETARFALALAIAEDPARLEEAFERARLAWEAESIGVVPDGLSTGIVRFSQNPFRNDTELSFVLAEAGPVKVDVFDLRGRRVRTLIDETRRAGVHRIGWSGRDSNGAEVASGVYLVRLQSAHEVESTAITRVR